MKVLWFTTVIMVASGAVLALAGSSFGLGPVALVCGVLLIWSGIVKVVVLRIWGRTLPTAPQSESQRPMPNSSPAISDSA